MINGRIRLARVLVTAVSLVALFGAIACGGGSSSGSKTPTPGPAIIAPTATNTPKTPDESAFAASMVATRADFPSDYRQTQKQADASKNPVAGACGIDGAPGRTGSAWSSDFLFDGDIPAVSEVVTVFATEADASASVESAPSRVACAIEAINAGRLNAGDVELSRATSAPIEIDAGGEASAAFSIQATGTLKSIQGAQVTAQYTLVFAYSGRVEYDFLARGTGDPVDLDSLSEVMRSAAERIRQQP